MSEINFIPVTTPEKCRLIEGLAFPIWREHYTPIIGAAQVEYMLRQRQTAQAVEEQVRQGDLYFLIQTGRGDEIGFFSIQFRPREVFLSKFYLLKDFRGKGLARKVLDFIRKMALEKQASRITLLVHKRNPSVKAYQALGFRILEPVATDIGNGYVMDDYRMGLDFV